MTKEHRAQLRDVKTRIKKAASDLAATRRFNARAFQAVNRSRRDALRSCSGIEARLHKNNRLAEKEHSKTTCALLKRQAILEGRLAS